MAEFSEFFKIIAELEDNDKARLRDVERINTLRNFLQKRNIPVERKRRKGRILKELQRNMRGWSESTRYTRFAIRCAIHEIRWQDFGCYDTPKEPPKTKKALVISGATAKHIRDCMSGTGDFS